MDIKDRFKALPYADDDLDYDYNSHRYVLTEKYVRDKLHIDINKYNDKNTVTMFCKMASRIVYSYIHKFNDSKTQDYIIAKTESGRRLIMEAMDAQYLDMDMNGMFMFSADKEQRELTISPLAKMTIEDTTIPEIGTTIIYAGKLYFCTCDKSRW